MTIPTSEILNILRAHGIVPEEELEGSELPAAHDAAFPEIGEIEEGEAVYATSLAEVLSGLDGGEAGISGSGNPRIRQWWSEVQPIIDRGQPDSRGISSELKEQGPTEPHCAWYCPVHFFGHSWGIYIRESCILYQALGIASLVDWRRVHASADSITRQLLCSAFYTVFLHEQFHHKVESLGLRLLIARGSDRYRPYKTDVYRPTYLTPDCLEESLANAESYRRLAEPRYAKRIDKPIREGVRDYLKATIPLQPPGYAEGVQYLLEPAYRDGLYRLQSQMLEGMLKTAMPLGHWSVAPNMITALTDITDDIYVVLPLGAKPIFQPTSMDPGVTVSSRALVGALTRHYGYQEVSGGKGSHIKLKKPGSQTIIIPGNRPVLSPGVVKHALEAIGGYPVSKLPDLIEGKLPVYA